MCPIVSNFLVVKCLLYGNLLLRQTDYRDYGQQWIYALYSTHTVLTFVYSITQIALPASAVYKVNEGVDVRPT